jgi:hypothetical protein
MRGTILSSVLLWSVVIGGDVWVWRHQTDVPK